MMATCIWKWINVLHAACLSINTKSWNSSRKHLILIKIMPLWYASLFCVVGWEIYKLKTYNMCKAIVTHETLCFASALYASIFTILTLNHWKIPSAPNCAVYSFRLCKSLYHLLRKFLEIHTGIFGWMESTLSFFLFVSHPHPHTL